jgi:hypothetical protein
MKIMEALNRLSGRMTHQCFSDSRHQTHAAEMVAVQVDQPGRIAAALGDDPAVDLVERARDAGLEVFFVQPAHIHRRHAVGRAREAFAVAVRR